MGDQNVKIRTSSLPDTPSPERPDDTADSFRMSEDKTPENDFGPGNSRFSYESQGKSYWNSMSTGRPRNAVVPGIPNDTGTIDALAEWSKETEKMRETLGTPYETKFQPKSAFDYLRLNFEPFTPFKLKDLKKNVPAIPRFATVYGQSKSTDYAKRYFMNRLGLINDLIKTTDKEIETQPDPRIKTVRAQFKRFLLEKKAFIEEQLKEAFKTESAET